MSYSLPVAGVVAALLALYFLRPKSKSSSLPLPPGPPKIPVLGNAHQLPKGQEWITYAKWGKEYGPIMSVTALGQPIIIINDQKIAIDLLDRKSGIYSDRPYLAMGGELVGWDHSLVLTPYGDRFRNMRKLFHRLIGARNSDQFWALEEKETRKFLLRILDEPQEFREHIRVTAGSIILLISHGYKVDPRPHQDPLVKLADLATEQFSESTEPGKWMVDLLPFLKHVPAWFPGAGFQKQAQEWRKTLEQLAEGPHKMVKDGIKKGTAPPSFTQELLESKDLDAFTKDEEETIKWAAASLYSGGADTTVSAISTFFLAATLHPSCVLKAQAELDRVVGPDRLPNFADRPNLPYCEAFLKEVLRWGPVVPTGVPHRTTKEDTYNGYLIPSGSLVFANIWGITRDENVYKSPEEFNPDRFLDTTSTADSKQTAFGYGRRICPGMNLADLSIFISIAMTLHVFDITSVVGEQKPVFEYTNGTISHPTPFKCTIKPRSPKAEGLIRAVEREEEWNYINNTMPGKREMDSVKPEFGNGHVDA